jgi:integrase
LEKLLAAAMSNKPDGEPVTKNGQQLCDFLRLLAFCGAREQEGIALRWQDVDFDREQLTIGAGGDTKNRSCRIVDFNPKLKAHLLDMKGRRAPDSQWVFPSPQRGDKDIHAKTFRVSLGLARAHAAKQQEAAGERPTLAAKAFHDLRHHFISYAVMSGIDFMTIASWVGHRDGGILIGKVYGHLADSHKKEQAQRLNFGPSVVLSVAPQETAVGQ